MNQFPTVTNEATGSVFHTIGTTPSGVRGSIRVWTEAAPTKQHTVFMFRFRVDPKDDGTTPLNFSNIAAAEFPGVKWAAKNDKYCSIAGSMLIDRPIWNVDAILGVIQTHKVFGMLFQRITTLFPSMQMAVNEDEFSEFMTEQILSILTSGLSDGASQTPAIIFNFGEMKAKLQSAPDAIDTQIATLAQTDAPPAENGEEIAGL